ncbi:MAG: hypothetical protein JWN69_2085 [Alphaproteobacteria bacterium]|nr:hypothetical protein [Alphaproteobacteria bacterium]
MGDEREFYAWLDGELDSEAATRVEAEVAADPRLQRLAEQHRAMHARLRAAFDPVAAAPVPAALLPSTSTGDVVDGDVVDLAAARTRRERRLVSPFWRQAAAMAATLVLGFAAGNMLAPPSAPIQREDGRLVAGGALGEALQTQLASAPAGDAPRIALTFRDRGGAICRSFTDAGASGLACRDQGVWRIRGLFQAPEGQQGAYRMASGNDPQLSAMIDQEMTGEPFDAEAERAAKQNGWR